MWNGLFLRSLIIDLWTNFLLRSSLNTSLIGFFLFNKYLSCYNSRRQRKRQFFLTMHSPVQILRKIASERFVSVSKLKKLMLDRTAGWRQKMTCWYDSFMSSLALLSEFIGALESSSFERTSSRSAVSCILYLWKIPSNLWIENDQWDLARADHLVYVLLELRRSRLELRFLWERSYIHVFPSTRHAKCTWTLMNHSRRLRPPSAAVSLPPWHDQCCRCHKAHRSLSWGHPVLWCARASVGRNLINARYPILESPNWKSSNVIRHSHQWSRQECSHASHGIFARWYFAHLRQRCSQPVLQSNKEKARRVLSVLTR